MNTYVAFLRGVNVSGQNKMKMADLRSCLEHSGFENVKTYIQSGNLVFDTTEDDRDKISTKIFSVIKNDFGFEVPVLVVKASLLQHVLDENPFSTIAEPKNQYFALLLEAPSDERKASFQQMKFDHEDFHYTDTCIYLHCKIGAGKAKLNNNLIENKLQTTATTRNLNTMKKMIVLAES